ncbi:hypothetical protein AU252_20095 [Pseudarthrobacter sulfonivorans]|uniref:RDD domain-containing protein n=1 Tax=Pseudarthrobacter sulfonivorans TaxID=121292 RepID=A0A0U3PLB8_9MICC|nr:RDD family protein [Pseudarthrobacter sulfonivorans]ALV43176.1 hypothetical protein AU252_20095 [Pseudarthrobacter sulfonivorans]
MVQEVGRIPEVLHAGPGLYSAGIGARIWANVIDGLLLQGIYIGLYFASFGAMLGAAQSGNYSTAITLMNVIGFVLPALWILLAIIYVAMLGRGQSLGMKLTGVRLVSLETLGAPGFWRAAGRNVVFALGALIVVGPFSPLFDDSGQRRGWHDKATNTWMIDERRRLAESATVGAPRNGAPFVAQVPAPAAVTPIVSPVQPPSPVPPPPPGFAPGLVTAAPSVPSWQPNAPAPAPQPQPVPAALADDDDDLDATRIGVVARAHRTWCLRLDDGQDIHLAARGFIGRNPADPEGQPNHAAGAAAQLIPVRDATKTVSKTHLAFGIDGSRLWVQERGSTNGTKIVRTTGEHLDVSSSTRSYAGNGDVLVLGDLRITVVGE